jgi:hypothetical protein
LTFTVKKEERVQQKSLCQSRTAAATTL